MPNVTLHGYLYLYPTFIHMLYIYKLCSKYGTWPLLMYILSATRGVLVDHSYRVGWWWKGSWTNKIVISTKHNAIYVWHDTHMHRQLLYNVAHINFGKWRLTKIPQRSIKGFPQSAWRPVQHRSSGSHFDSAQQDCTWGSRSRAPYLYEGRWHHHETHQRSRPWDHWRNLGPPCLLGKHK